MDRKKHSGLGIASFVTSIASGALLFTVIVIAGIMEANTPGTFDDESSLVMIVGSLIVIFLLVSLVGLGLGVAGLTQKNRNQIFSILGIVLSAVATFGTLLLVLIGNLMD